MQFSPLIKYGIIFAIIPVLATYMLGHAVKILFAPDLQSFAEMDPSDPDRSFVPVPKYIFPYACMSGLIAFFVWLGLLRKKPSIISAVVAGPLAVFLSYPILGFAIGFMNPDIEFSSRLFSGFSGMLTLVLIGNFLTFWITYPFGAICGGFLGNKLITAQKPQVAKQFD